jgi:hypothetical protein
MPALTRPQKITFAEMRDMGVLGRHFGVQSCLSSHGMRTGKDEQSAAALPFRTQAGIGDRVRTGGCYRGTGNCQKECYDAERS